MHPYNAHSHSNDAAGPSSAPYRPAPAGTPARYATWMGTSFDFHEPLTALEIKSFIGSPAHGTTGATSTTTSIAQLSSSSELAERLAAADRTALRFEQFHRVHPHAATWGKPGLGSSYYTIQARRALSFRDRWRRPLLRLTLPLRPAPTPAVAKAPNCFRLFDLPGELRNLIYDQLHKDSIHSDPSRSGHVWHVRRALPQPRFISRQFRDEFDRRASRFSHVHVTDHEDMAFDKVVKGPGRIAEKTALLTADLLMLYTKMDPCIAHCAVYEVDGHCRWITYAIRTMPEVREIRLKIFLLSGERVGRAYLQLMRQLPRLQRLWQVRKIEIYAYEGERAAVKECDPKHLIAVFDKKSANDKNEVLEQPGVKLLEVLEKKAQDARRRKRKAEREAKAKAEAEAEAETRAIAEQEATATEESEGMEDGTAAGPLEVEAEQDEDSDTDHSKPDCVLHHS